MKKIHEQDFNLWVESQAIAIRNRDVEAMDWDSLLEEIEDMGASQKRALRSYYYRLVEHILKLRDWDAEVERNRTKWRIEVSNFRRGIKDILEDSPSLNNYLQDNYANWYTKTIDNYKKNKLFTINDATVISLSQMMNDDYFGD